MLNRMPFAKASQGLAVQHGPAQQPDTNAFKRPNNTHRLLAICIRKALDLPNQDLLIAGANAQGEQLVAQHSKLEGDPEAFADVVDPDTRRALPLDGRRPRKTLGLVHHVRSLLQQVRTKNRQPM